MTETRICAGNCGRELPLEMFGDTEKKKFITCLDCRAYKTAWRNNNLEAARKSSSNYSKNNREKERNKVKKWRENNPEHHKQITQDYINSPHGKALRHNNQIKRRANLGNQEITVEEWLSVMEMNDWKCIYCDKKLAGKRNITVDHLIPVSKGGQHRVGNLVPCCNWCNCSKRDWLLKDWYIFQTLSEEKQDFLLEMERLELEKMNNHDPETD